MKLHVVLCLLVLIFASCEMARVDPTPGKCVINIHSKMIFRILDNGTDGMLVQSVIMPNQELFINPLSDGSWRRAECPKASSEK